MPEQQSKKSIPLTEDLLSRWATDPKGAVALHLRQRLLPVEAVEGEQGIVFPPTYADIGYNIDSLSDGRVATIDSVGSQANRMEPLFKTGGPLADIVPQISIKINNGNTVSIFDLPHRAADATVQSSPGLAELAAGAFNCLKQGDAAPLCALAPTSLLFGVWDSRGGTGEKRPRLVRSLIRAWDVEVLHSAAQFNSIWKRLDETQRDDLKKVEKKKGDLAVKGFADAPATFRRTKIAQPPNPEARVLGGVRVRGRIEREVTLNLLALRGLRGADEAESNAVRKYLLGLALLAATQEMDLFLREGCLLRYARSEGDVWHEVPRRGDPQTINLSGSEAVITSFIKAPLERFKGRWPKSAEYVFDMAKAKELLAKRVEQEEEIPQLG